jgi:hypothetical protein
MDDDYKQIKKEYSKLASLRNILDTLFPKEKVEINYNTIFTNFIVRSSMIHDPYNIISNAVVLLTTSTN